jgi:UDP-N-acetylglucosamine--N-acetylmuramyl-(pentapeptide) pyrophosphoryl-undecaprenol N-acetylglucosamine transferase
MHYIGQGSHLEHRMLSCGDRLLCHSVMSGKFRRYHGDSLWAHLSDIPTLIRNARDVGKVIIGFVQSFWLLMRIRPQVVFSKGGYTALPVGLAAAVLRIRLITHDSDVVPGLTNRVLRRFASATACGFPREGSTFTGNPVNPDVRSAPAAAWGSGKPVVMFMGGSSGAKVINQLVFGNVDRLRERYTVLHITGQADFHGAPEPDPDYRPYDFVDPATMGGLLKSADVVLSRAGANAIADLAACGAAAVLIPGRQMTGGQQLRNATTVTARGAAYLLGEEHLSLDSVTEAIDYVYAHQQQYRRAIQALDQPQAAAELATMITGGSNHVS